MPGKGEHGIAHRNVEMAVGACLVVLAQREQDVDDGGKASTHDIRDQRRRHYWRISFRLLSQQAGAADVIEVVLRLSLPAKGG